MPIEPTRNIYLHDVPLDEAIADWHSALAAAGLLAPLDAETIPLTEALHRVTAQPVWARISSPHYHAAAMDGYAVRAEDTNGATERMPLALALSEAKGRKGEGEQGSTLSPLLPFSPALAL